MHQSGTSTTEVPPLLMMATSVLALTITHPQFSTAQVKQEDQVGCSDAQCSRYHHYVFFPGSPLHLQIGPSYIRVSIHDILH